MIVLAAKHLNQIRTHAESIYPEECCGLLLGTIDKSDKMLREVWPAQNSWNARAAISWGEIEKSTTTAASKHNRFSIAPQVIFQVQKQARERQLAIIGIYHSHPDCPPVPSEFDRAIAWPSYSYVIVSVQQGNATEIRSWMLDDNHHFQPEEIVMGGNSEE